MHRARTFFYVCAGLLCLALAYHFGAVNATAQAPGNPLVSIAPYPGGGPSGTLIAASANGDVFYTNGAGNPWSHVGNVFAGPTPAKHETWGALKSRYRGERGAAQPAPQDR